MKRNILLSIFFVLLVIESIALVRAGEVIKAKDKSLAEYAVIIDIKNAIAQQTTGTNDLLKQLDYAKLPKSSLKPGVTYTPTINKNQYSTPGAYFLGNDGTICYRIADYTFCRNN